MKLWTAFFVCALIPVTTMFFVVDLFSIEGFNSRLSQEKADLQRFLDLFEHRQTFSEPLAWKTIKNFSYSKELKAAIAKVDQQDPANRDFSPIHEVFKNFTAQIAELKKTVGNFDPRDTAIVSKAGWEFANHGERLKNLDYQVEAVKLAEEKNETETDSPEKENKFAYVLIKVGQNLLSRMRNEARNENVDAAKLEGEIAVKKGLQIVSSMFGESVGIKLANGVGLPVKMEIIDSVSGIIIHPVDQIFMPDYIVIWMILFHNSGYLTQIASLFSGDRAIFSISSGSYGNATSAFNHLIDFGLTRLSSWVVSSNRPVSTMQEINDQEFMIETRRGIQQSSMIITGAKPIKPIRQSIWKTKLAFLQLLLLSILLIAFMAKNVSAEIIEPIQLLTQGMKEIGKENVSYRINISRSDELGDLCDSFDRMARGLEEKLLIGKMLSQTALDSTLQETSSKKEELVVFYIGSPGFSSWLGLSSPAELFTDLQKQISEIAAIILAEGGEIDKIIGEKILAIFRGDQIKASIAACRVGQKILQAEQKGELPFPVAGGINGGVVISGILGVGNKKDFTIIGDTVNVAARIENLAESMRYHRILVSEEIFKAIEKLIPAREYGKVELKGKSTAAKVFQLDA
jgi:class 3 adenylate cyclase